MIPHPTLHWNEILAAYADGEFEGRDDLAILKQRVEDWLARHPEAVQELAQLRQLKAAWQESTPDEPAPAAWQRIVQALAKSPNRATRPRRPWKRGAVVAAALAACVVAGVAIWSTRFRGAVEPAPAPVAVADDEPLPVAAAHEVEILRVEGADTQTLVVGALPVQGPLELAGPGEVTVTSVQPAVRDNMMPEVRTQGPGRPMIWARLDTD
ncbi:MAG: hypothetical protein L0Y71_05570 [Gemmataceae bacterium]|nr:hypothetical protein [Gemmataceae bacterium]